jgi:hypothetical protein
MLSAKRKHFRLRVRGTRRRIFRLYSSLAQAHNPKTVVDTRPQTPGKEAIVPGQYFAEWSNLE